MSLMLGDYNQMAIYKNSGNGTIAISGKIAGTVWASGGSQGPFMRVWAHPRNRRTASQTTVRGRLSGVSSSWDSLTAAQVAAWNTTAQGDSGLALRRNVFGDTRKISGSQLFQRVNNILLVGSSATLTNPPIAGTTDAILTATPTGSAGGNTLTTILTTFAAGVTVPANTKMYVYATAQKPVGRSYFGKSQYRFLQVVNAAASINPASLTAAYTAKFGAMILNAKIGLRFHFVFSNAGVFSKGGDVYATCTVGA